MPHSKATRIGTIHNIWALSTVCRLVRHEYLPLLPKTSDLMFRLLDFDKPSLGKWLTAMGSHRIQTINHIKITGHALCGDVDKAGGGHSWV